MITLSLGAQTRVQGTIVDAKTNEGIAFANVGVPGRGIGTVSDEQGRYFIVIPDSLAKESLRFSCIGYKAQSLAIASSKFEKVQLNAEVLRLDEITVKAPKLKIKMAGNDTRNTFISAGFKENNLGAEMAVRIKVKKPNTEIRHFYINIVRNTLDTNLMLRLNIYALDKDGLPGENILKAPILLKAKSGNKLLEADLRPYNILVSNDVFLSIEWIKDLGDATSLFFSAQVGGSDSYYRKASQDAWHKIPGFGLGLHAEIGY
jgi:hypothetical protein